MGENWFQGWAKIGFRGAKIGTSEHFIKTQNFNKNELVNDKNLVESLNQIVYQRSTTNRTENHKLSLNSRQIS